VKAEDRGEGVEAVEEGVREVGRGGGRTRKVHLDGTHEPRFLG